MATTLQRQDDVKLALMFLDKLTKNKKRIYYWPGPVALLVLGRSTVDESIHSATGAKELGQAKQIAEADSFMRLQLTNVLFGAAVERRLARDEAACGAYRAECASLGDPLIGYEWHLAKKEVSQ